MTNLIFKSKVCCIFLSVLGIPSLLFAQTYTHPTTGLASTYVGSCMVNTCSGTYYDNGGAGANYAGNINNIYRTFCPSTPGMCVRATFTSFSMNDTYFLCSGPNSCCDYLSILNGPTQNSAALYSNCVASPGTVTASNTSGCLTFRFFSDGSVQLGGWAATLSCVACGVQSNGVNSDCANSTVLCSNVASQAVSPGPGTTSNGCSGCFVGGENFSNWFNVVIQTSGTLAFTIDPSNNSNDFDVAVFGPNVTCGALGSPIRCTAAGSAGNGNTGLGNGAVDNSEDITGDQWVAPINVTAGQSYRVVVNGWSAANSPYAINFTGTAGLNCTPLPIELESFQCIPTTNNEIEIHWVTASEVNNDYFIIERSIDGIHYEELARVQGSSGNSNETLEYIVADANPVFGINYYRLTQVDYNGNREIFDPSSCNYGDQLIKIKEVLIYDLNGQLILQQAENTADLKTTIMSLQVPAGMYMLYLVFEDGTSQVRKFVKI